MPSKAVSAFDIDQREAMSELRRAVRALEMRSSLLCESASGRELPSESLKRRDIALPFAALIGAVVFMFGGRDGSCGRRQRPRTFSGAIRSSRIDRHSER
jgi:hypothetical protein